jgi:hypothetical protein
VALTLGREPGLFTRPAARGAVAEQQGQGDNSGRTRRTRFSVNGRELLDSMDATLRYDFAARSLPGHGLKAVARHFGLASAEREQIPGARVYEVYQSDPERVRRYASADVHEASALGRVLGGAAFALARLAPRRYERLADAGPACSPARRCRPTKVVMARCTRAQPCTCLPPGSRSASSRPTWPACIHP